ncbi:unnamed protein product [Linum tenue]|uniref:Uncharacterized protein n=1 Tax=Linum tenue TaxID=586396 RepID=A0AAV0HXV8_9ROSI|nr:unnamed protein product [Linum tenue]
MSGGTPRGGYVRQRHSQGGYGSSGDDLEDDACSRPQQHFSPTPPRVRSWVEILENLLWIASSLFIVYYGDRHSNLIYLLWHDGRIRSAGVEERARVNFVAEFTLFMAFMIIFPSVIVGTLRQQGDAFRID